MAEVPRRPLSISIDWLEPDERPDWWPDDEDWTSTGSWSVSLEDHGEILSNTTYSNDDGFPTLAEAVTAAEKWCTDRRLDITTFGVTLRATDKPLRGNG